MVDIASLLNATQAAEKNLARAADNYSGRIGQVLGLIEAIEETLRERRERIEDIRARHEALAREYRELGRSLDSATADLADQFAGVIGELGSDAAIAKLLAGPYEPVADSDLAPEAESPPRMPDRARTVPESADEEAVDLDSLQAGFDRVLRRPRRSTAKSEHQKLNLTPPAS